MSPKSIALALGTVLLAWTVYADASSQFGFINRIHVRATDGLVYFYVDGQRSTPPPCATQPYWVIANEGSTAGKQQLAMLMMAQASGKPVTIFGSGDCARWSDGESVSEIAVQD
jgi:hypothetical protein